MYACPWELNLDKLQACARLFEGEHDFQSFAANDPDLTERNSARSETGDDTGPSETSMASTVRTITSSLWEARLDEAGRILVYRVRGNGFLHHMVRNLVGTMLDVGRGHLTLEEIPRILAARDRSAAGPTAPARGLFLHSVEYDDQAF